MVFNAFETPKIEDPRYLYWADKLGLLVWEEMPSAYRFTRTAIKRTVREWSEAIERDYSHPCVFVWVPFNESWGVPDLTAKHTHRHAVEALYHLTRTLDQPDGNRTTVWKAVRRNRLSDTTQNRPYGSVMDPRSNPRNFFDRRRLGRILTDRRITRTRAAYADRNGGVRVRRYEIERQQTRLHYSPREASSLNFRSFAHGDNRHSLAALLYNHPNVSEAMIAVPDSTRKSSGLLKKRRPLRHARTRKWCCIVCRC